MVFGPLYLLHRETRVRHSEWCEDLLANRAFPSESCNFPFEITHRHDRQIVVLIGAPKAFVRLKIAKVVEQIFAAEIAGVPHQVMSGQTGAMRKKITGSGFLTLDGILHLKIREIVAGT